MAIESSNLSTSTGDEPGSAGGIISSKTKGKLTWQTRSLDVKFEGKGVVRFGDITLHNGNSFNTAFMQNGGTGFAYGDDFKDACPICGESPEKHAVIEKVEESRATALAILAELNERESKLREVEVEIESLPKKLEREIRINPAMKPATLEKKERELQEALATKQAQADTRSNRHARNELARHQKSPAIEHGLRPPLHGTL